MDTDERKKRIEQLRWQAEREKLREEFKGKVVEIISLDRLIFLSNEDSDLFDSEPWPSEFLYIQSPVEQPDPIEKVLSGFLNLVEEDFVYLLFTNYPFGLVQVEKKDLFKHWRAFIELDGDDFLCLRPTQKDFICIEKTEAAIKEKTKDGMRIVYPGIKGKPERGWIYELTFSNEELKRRLT